MPVTRPVFAAAPDPSSLAYISLLNQLANELLILDIRTANFAAVRGYRYCCTVNGLTATLPASPAEGDMIRFTPGSTAVTSITLARNGNNINSAAANKTISADAWCMYINSTIGWLVTEPPATPTILDDPSLLDNLTIATSRAGNAETIALKTKAGTDASASDKIRVAFRSATAGNGDYSILEITAALSVTIPSTATMGMSNSVPARLWLVLFNDAGTARLGVINTQLTDGIAALADNDLRSSTLMDTASDNAGVIYTGAAVTSKAMRVLGYLEYTLATAGTWNTAPSIVRQYTPGQALPGDVVQLRRSQTGAVATTTTTLPWDDTIPQNTEGGEFMTQAITPTSAINQLRIDIVANFAVSTVDQVTMALFQDSTANALASISAQYASANQSFSAVLTHQQRAATTSATTFRMRAGAVAAGTLTFNGSAGARKFGGVAASVLQVQEIMA
ncbi:MAG: hypothetical protein JNM76_14570 [Betaproteobacteria bacterium]|nr:hypothetical protein [Betaproteobacteria bacterium]